ncbi:hypothetical protein WME75_19090 [Sorangium sp. So ce1014]
MIRPPWASTILFASAGPSPMPPVARVRLLSARKEGRRQLLLGAVQRDQAIGHLVEGARKIADLVLPRDRRARLDPARAEGPGHRAQALDGVRHGSGARPARR